MLSPGNATYILYKVCVMMCYLPNLLIVFLSLNLCLHMSHMMSFLRSCYLFVFLVAWTTYSASRKISPSIAGEFLHDVFRVFVSLI